MTATDRCGDCYVEPGSAHVGGCDVARCLHTGHQQLSCDGKDHDCGDDVWTGDWPGAAECREFGWWVQDRCVEGMGWVPCSADAPGATEDLNRLRFGARWDVDNHRWVLR